MNIQAKDVSGGYAYILQLSRSLVQHQALNSRDNKLWTSQAAHIPQASRCLIQHFALNYSGNKLWTVEKQLQQRKKKKKEKTLIPRDVCKSGTYVSHYQYCESRTPCTIVEFSGSNEKGPTMLIQDSILTTNLTLKTTIWTCCSAPLLTVMHQVLFTRHTAAQKKPRQRMRWTHTGINLPPPPPPTHTHFIIGCLKRRHCWLNSRQHYCLVFTVLFADRMCQNQQLCYAGKW